MRLGWFAPMPLPDGREPPDPSAAAVPLLAAHHDIEVFAGTAAEASAWSGWAVPVHDAYDFVWRHRQRPYDLVVYQLSDEPRHDYVWGYLWNCPGLVVLQDVHLHDARARILLDGRDARFVDYAEELRFNHAVDVGVGGSLAAFTGPVLHVWPMRRAVVAAGRLIAVHNELLAQDLRLESPAAVVEVIRPGVPSPGLHPVLRQRPEARAFRAQHDLPHDAIVVAMFGPFTRSRRVSEVIRVLATLRESDPLLHLLLVGGGTEEYDPLGDAQANGVLSRVRLTGPVPQSSMAAALGAADLAICARWPTRGETPTDWLTCLSAGLPAIITDLSHNADLPVLDPRDWTTQHVGRSGSVPEPLAVLVDLVDEAGTLRLALRRLAADASLRQLIARGGRAWWSRQRTPEVMTVDYLGAIARAAERRAPDVPLPAHLRPDVFGHARTLLQSVGARLPDELTHDAGPSRPGNAGG